MTDRDRLELVSAAVDGELDDEQRAELEALLETSEEARQLMADLEQLDSLLKCVPALDPAESLHARIMAGVEPQSPTSKSSALYWLRQLVPGTGLRYAIAASTGAFVAAAIIVGQTPMTGLTDPSDFVGTMAPGLETGRSEILDSYWYTDGPVDSRIQLRIAGEKLFLDVSTDTDRSVDIAIDLESTGLWPDVMAQLEGRSRSIAAAGQKVELQAEGQQRAIILLQRTDDVALAGEAIIRLELSSQGRLLGRGALKTNR